MANQTVVQKSGIDSTLVQATPTKNYVSNVSINVQSGSGTSRYITAFFSRPFPLKATIVSAKLRFYQQGAATGGSRTIFAYRTGPWVGSKVTWANQPTITGTPASRTLGDGGATGRLWEFDVTAHMQAVSDGAAWYGWRLVQSGATNILNFHSFDHPSIQYRPTLEITWALEPKAPVTLNPGGGRAVALAKPVLAFDFSDFAGDTSMSGYQVQINGTNSFTSPAFDTGEVASSVPQCDLSGTSYAGITDGSSMWWRVRTKDGAGLWSGWSVGTQVFRDDKGVITITNPAVSPNNFVEEATPPVTWSFSGETQVSWQVLILDGNTPSRVIADSGKRTNTDTGWTIAAGTAGTPLIQPGGSYIAEVRIWDTKNRAGTVGDPAYTSTQRAFTFQATTSVSPTVGITAEQIGASPSVKLTWTRSTSPDAFTILRDGKAIKADLSPAQLLVSGTTYSWTDNGADPRVEHVWSVQAVVNGKASANNATATFTSKPRGIWLSDPDKGIAIEIDGNEQGTWSMPEQGENHSVLGATYPTRLTQALGGYEGSVTGVLVSITGENLTAQQKKALVWQIKSNPSRVVYLTLSDMTLPIVAYNILIIPSPIEEMMFGISFDFIQVGSLPFKAVGA